MLINASTGRLETHDVEEQNETTRPWWDVYRRQMSPGEFRVTTDYVQVNGIFFFRQHFTKRVLAKGVAAPKGYLMLGCSHTPETSINWCGAEINDQCFALGQSTAETEYVIPDNSHHWSIFIPENLVFRYLEQEAIESSPLRNAHFLVCEPGLGRDIAGLVPQPCHQP